MQADVPTIYQRPTSTSRVLLEGRFLAAVIAATCLALLIVASRLTPNPDGLGTHREMGLDQCGWLRVTGIPCPACGMTTSFAWFVRGNFAASFYVQPMGGVLAAICCMAVWGGAYISITARPAYRLFSTLGAQYHLIPLLTFAVIAWVWKIFIHLHGIDGWRR